MPRVRWSGCAQAMEGTFPNPTRILPFARGERRRRRTIPEGKECASDLLFHSTSRRSGLSEGCPPRVPSRASVRVARRITARRELDIPQLGGREENSARGGGRDLEPCWLRETSANEHGGARQEKEKRLGPPVRRPVPPGDRNRAEGDRRGEKQSLEPVVVENPVTCQREKRDRDGQGRAVNRAQEPRQGRDRRQELASRAESSARAGVRADLVRFAGATHKRPAVHGRIASYIHLYSSRLPSTARMGRAERAPRRVRLRSPLPRAPFLPNKAALERREKAGPGHPPADQDHAPFPRAGHLGLRGEHLELPWNPLELPWTAFPGKP